MLINIIKINSAKFQFYILLSSQLKRSHLVTEESALVCRQQKYPCSACIGYMYFTRPPQQLIFMHNQGCVVHTQITHVTSGQVCVRVSTDVPCGSQYIRHLALATLQVSLPVVDIQQHEGGVQFPEIIVLFGVE